jgi:hypothetical protein
MPTHAFPAQVHNPLSCSPSTPVRRYINAGRPDWVRLMARSGGYATALVIAAPNTRANPLSSTPGVPIALHSRLDVLPLIPNLSHSLQDMRRTRDAQWSCGQLIHELLFI